MAQHLALPRTEPSAGDLPTYLGFGILDRSSVRSEDGWLSATYRDAHDIVYEVRWNHNGCLLTSYWRGREVARSGGVDLAKASFYSWLGVEKSPEKDERFIDLSNEVIRAGNVYFIFPRPEWVSFPAGLIFMLRQPITPSTQPTWEALKATLPSEAGPELRPRVYQEGPGRIVHVLDDGDTWTEPVHVVDLVVPLAGVVQAVNTCVRAGIVPPGSHHRLVVSLANVSAVWQPGDARERERAFAVVHNEGADAAGAVAALRPTDPGSTIDMADGGAL